MPIGHITLHTDIYDHLRPEMTKLLHHYLDQGTVITVKRGKQVIDYTVDHPDFIADKAESTEYVLHFRRSVDQDGNPCYTIEKLSLIEDQGHLVTVKHYSVHGGQSAI